MILPRTSEGLYLLQRVRDEAHRFAITFHRQRRSKAMTASALDDDPGPGGGRGARRCCGTSARSRRLRAASEEQIREVPGIGPALAATIAADAGGTGGARAVPAVNVTTGEVLD